MPEYNFNLQPFDTKSSPQIPHCEADLFKISGKIARQNDLLTLNYLVTGDIAAISYPAIPVTPKRQNKLWEHTCFEFFLGIKNTTQYWEFNLAPTGDWNVYHFDDYRQGMRTEIAFNSLPFQFTKNSQNLQLDIKLDLKPLISSNTDLKVGISAVIEDERNDISYWALTHPGKEADFHNRDSCIFFL